MTVALIKAHDLVAARLEWEQFNHYRLLGTGTNVADTLKVSVL